MQISNFLRMLRRIDRDLSFLSLRGDILEISWSGGTDLRSVLRNASLGPRWNEPFQFIEMAPPSVPAFGTRSIKSEDNVGAGTAAMIAFTLSTSREIVELRRISVG